MTAPVVQLVGVCKGFPGVAALRGVDLELRPGRVHALVGENGAGKSTLLNLLAGLLQPDSGEVRIDGVAVRLDGPRAAWAVGVVTVHQEVDLLPDLSVTENIAWQRGLGGRFGLIPWSAERRRAAEALALVGCTVSPDALASSLTPAQRQLVEIAGAASREARVLILDEPTSSLSAAESERLFVLVRRFRERGAAVVYVSHRLEEVFALADDITVLRDGVRVWTGPAAETTPAGLIRHMVGRDVVSEKREAARPGRVRLSCTGLTARDDSFRDVTLEVRAGEVLGLYGLIGAGRTEWAQAVFGLRSIASGEVCVDGAKMSPTGPGQMARCGIAYVPEDRLRQGLCRGLGVTLNAVLASLRRLSRLGWLSGRDERDSANRVVTRLGVRLASLAQPVGTLSGGNQQKLVVGRWLEREPGVLILDEPTRGVDVGARGEIYDVVRRLTDEGRAVVLISSDLPEVMGQSDRVGVFCAGQLVCVVEANATSAEEVAAAAFAKREPEALAREGAVPSLTLRALVPGEVALAAFVAVLFLALHLATGRFLQPDNLSAIASNAAALGFCAAGAAIVLLAGGLDISLGAILALSAAVAGSLWRDGGAFPLVILTAVGVGGCAGALNAAVSLAGRVHPIVVTLGTMSVYRGLALWWLNGEHLRIPSEQRGWADLTPWLGLGLALILSLVLSRTVAGRELYALGSNARAALRVGVRPARVWLTAFALQGALAGFAGLLYLARSGGMDSTSYESQTLEAIASAVVGGVAITGGRGSVVGVAVGCVLLVSLLPACTFLGISSRWEQVLVGAALLAAVLFDARARRRAD